MNCSPEFISSVGRDGTVYTDVITSESSQPNDPLARYCRMLGGIVQAIEELA